jgi:uncharacterized protein YrrD
MRSAVDLVGHSVLEDGSQRVIGTVTDVLFDDDCRHVLAFLARDLAHGGCSTIALEDVRRFGEQAIVARVTLEGFAAASARAEGATSGSLQGRPVVSVRRAYLGTLNDVYFDERSSRVLAFEVRMWNPRRTSLKLRLFGVENARLINGVFVVTGGNRNKAVGRRTH